MTSKQRRFNVEETMYKRQVPAEYVIHRVAIYTLEQTSSWIMWLFLSQ